MPQKCPCFSIADKPNTTGNPLCSSKVPTVSKKNRKQRRGNTKNIAALVAADEWMRSYGGIKVVVVGGERTAKVTVKWL